jgi:type IV secretory pathway TrbD component
MTPNDEDLLPLRPVHRSLERRITIKGGERELVMLVILFGLLVGLVDTLGFGGLIGIPLGTIVIVGGLWIVREMGKADIHMSKVARRSFTYRKSYSARGRPMAKVPTVRDYR